MFGYLKGEKKVLVGNVARRLEELLYEKYQELKLDILGLEISNKIKIVNLKEKIKAMLIMSFKGI